MLQPILTLTTAALVLAIASPRAGQSVKPAAPLTHVDGLGSISFPNSGNAAAQAPFIRGVLLLHSFEYDTAAEAFRQAQTADAGFALAYWGEAMTYNHPLWQQQDRDAALKALDGWRRRRRRAPRKRRPIASGSISPRSRRCTRGRLEARSRSGLHARDGAAAERVSRGHGSARVSRARHPRQPRRRARLRHVRPRGRHRPAGVRRESRSPGRRALSHPLVRRSGPRAARVAGGAQILVDCAGRRARPAHDQPHLRRARHVGRRREGERAGAGRAERRSREARRASGRMRALHVMAAVRLSDAGTDGKGRGG